MLLREYGNGYHLEFGHGLNWDKYDNYELVRNILKVFGDEDDMFLFEFTECNKELDPDKDEMEESFFKEFHTQGEYNNCERIITPIKEVLYQYYKNLNNCEEISEDECVDKFRNTSLDKIKPSLINKVKEILYNNLYSTELKDYSEEFQEFVNKRVKFISEEWYFPPEYDCHFDEPDSYMRTLWMNLTEKEDMLKWIKDNYFFLYCIVLGKDKPLEKYKYYLMYRESGPDASMGLRIVERTKGEFLRTVFPKLQKLFNNEIKYEKL